MLVVKEKTSSIRNEDKVDNSSQVLEVLNAASSVHLAIVVPSGNDA